MHFWGATSTALSTVFRLERVPFEKNVFAFQWTASELGSSNAVFIIEAFVNYGLSGVLIFGLFVGQTLRWFALSRDDAFKAMWVLWCYNIFIAGMIGTLLSNGYALLLLLGLFVTVQTKAQTPRRMSWLVPSR